MDKEIHDFVGGVMSALLRRDGCGIEVNWTGSIVTVRISSRGGMSNPSAVFLAHVYNVAEIQHFVGGPRNFGELRGEQLAREFAREEAAA